MKQLSQNIILAIKKECVAGPHYFQEGIMERGAEIALSIQNATARKGHAMSDVLKDWSEPDQNEAIDVPDELMPLFNKIATQIRLHTISGKGEVLTIAHIIQHAQEFFTDVKYQRT